jgi:hypothetical protein
MRIASGLTSLALLVGTPVIAPSVAAAKAKTAKPHAGQFCSPRKMAPKGFKCKKQGKGKKARYRLVKG